MAVDRRHKKGCALVGAYGVQLRAAIDQGADRTDMAVTGSVHKRSESTARIWGTASVTILRLNRHDAWDGDGSRGSRRLRSTLWTRRLSGYRLRVCGGS